MIAELVLFKSLIRVALNASYLVTLEVYTMVSSEMYRHVIPIRAWVSFPSQSRGGGGGGADQIQGKTLRRSGIPDFCFWLKMAAMQATFKTHCPDPKRTF